MAHVQGPGPEIWKAIIMVSMNTTYPELKSKIISVILDAQPCSSQGCLTPQQLKFDTIELHLMAPRLGGSAVAGAYVNVDHANFHEALAFFATSMLVVKLV